MRKTLDVIYDGSAWLAALAMISTLVTVLLSVLGRQLNFHIPGIDAYAGYAMAGSGFLAMAHTLKHNEHIRVTLILGRLQGRAKHALEMWALSAAVFLSGVFAFYSVRLVWQSRAFNDVSTSNDATPLWIPQLMMAVGAMVLLLAFIDEWVLEMRGLRQVTESEEALHNE